MIELVPPHSVYFGHPINFYNTAKEAELIEIIQKEFPGFDIENPNQTHHTRNYLEWKKEKGSGMAYFFDIVLPGCEKGVFMSFEDGMFGAGVFGEAEAMQRMERPIYELNVRGIIIPMLIDYSRKLSIEETRERVYGKK